MSLSCSRENFSKIIAENPRLLFVFVQKGCRPCHDFKELIKEASPDMSDLNVAEVELGTGEMDCEILADQHEVDKMPSLAYYEKGRLLKKWVPTGIREQDKAELIRVAQSSVAPATPETAPVS